MNKNKSGFTLIEILFVVLVIGILSALSIPRLNFSGRQAYLAARKIVFDLRYTRTLAVTSGTRHYLKLLTTSPYASYAIYKDSATPVQIGETRTISSKVGCTATGFDSGVFKFSYLGVRYSSTNDASVTFSNGGQSYTVTIIAATGRIIETKN